MNKTLSITVIAATCLVGCSSASLVRARHILFEIPARASAAERNAILKEAKKVRAELVGGADFEQAARSHSACPSKAKGGDLGVFGKGQMVKPFEEAAFKQAKGEIGPLVRTRFGYHIVQVLERGGPELQSSE